MSSEPNGRLGGLSRRRILSQEAQGLSQYAMADKGGISRPYVRKLEAGLSDPTFGMLQRPAKVLKVSLVELMQ